jgi:MFS family permease
VPEPPREGPLTFVTAITGMARLRATWLGLAFALVSAAAFEATGQLAGPYLIDRGVASDVVGLFFGVCVVGAMLVGGLAGGVLADRRGRIDTALAGLTGFVGAIVLLSMADLGGATGRAVLIGLLTVMYFFVGLFTASTYALFMDLTSPRLGATQFSAFMAGTNACESWTAWAAGALVVAYGYPQAFLTMCAVSLVGLPLLHRLRTSAIRAA